VRRFFWALTALFTRATGHLTFCIEPAGLLPAGNFGIW